MSTDPMIPLSYERHMKIIERLHDWWFGIERCRNCRAPFRVSARLLGGIVPYEWVECDCASGWGSRL